MIYKKIPFLLLFVVALVTGLKSQSPTGRIELNEVTCVERPIKPDASGMDSIGAEKALFPFYLQNQEKAGKYLVDENGIFILGRARYFGNDSTASDQRMAQTFSQADWAFAQWRKGKDLSKEHGWKFLGRWFDFQARRTDGSGRLPEAKAVQQGYREAMAQRQFPAAKTTNQNWVPAGPFGYPNALDPSWEEGVGRVNCIAFHPTQSNTYFAGVAQGGVWKTTDDGASWTPLTDDLPQLRVSDIAINSANPDEMYISLGDYAYIGVALETDDRKRHTHYGLGVYKTTDGGQNWSPTGLSFVNTDFDGSLTRRVFIRASNSQELVAAGTHGIWKSYDSGSNWNRVQDSLIWDLEQDPNNPDILYASTGYVANLDEGSCGIMKSTDFGSSWTVLNTGIPARGQAQRIEIAVAPSNSQTIYAIACGMDRGFFGLYRSTNGGSTWTLRSDSPNILHWYEGQGTGGQGTYDLVLAVHPGNEFAVYAGGINMWASSDGGATWNGASYWRNDYGESIHADQHQLKYSPLQDRFFICNDGGIYSTDSIAPGDWNDVQNVPGYQWPTVWTRHSYGMNATSFYRVGVSEGNTGHLIAGAQDNSTYYFDGVNWSNIIGGDGMDGFLHPSISGQLWGSYQYGNLAMSYDGGLNINYGLNNSIPESGEWVTPWDLDPNNPSILYAGFGNIYKSNNDGFGWSPISNFPVVAGFGHPNICSDMAVAPSNPNYIYASKRPFFDAGLPAEMWATSSASTGVWQNVSAGLPDSLYHTMIAVDGDDPQTAWVTMGGFVSGVKVFKTTDAGANWTNISYNLPNLPVNCIVEHTGHPANPVYIGTDVGVYYLNDSLNAWQLYSAGLPNVIVSDLDIHYGEEKVYAATFGRGLWGVELRDVQAVAVAEGLYQSEMKVYPNPGRGDFTLEIHGELEGTAQLVVLDVQGKPVLRSEFAPENGFYRKRFDANLPAGLYFIQVRSGPLSKTIRWIVQ